MSITQEPMLEMFIFETSQLLEQLEQVVITCEAEECFGQAEVNEVFRIMHTIKGSSAMMLVNEVASLAHAIEDVFYYLRESKPKAVDCATLSDLLLAGIDFIKGEIEKIKLGRQADANSGALIDNITCFLEAIKGNNDMVDLKEKTETKKPAQFYISPSKSLQNLNHFKATIFFEDGCQMENIRAYTVVQNLKDIASDLRYEPDDVLDNDDSSAIIKESGFKVWLATPRTYQEIHETLKQTIFLKDLDVIEINPDEGQTEEAPKKQIYLDDQFPKTPVLEPKPEPKEADNESLTTMQQSIISVSVAKLDRLMDLVGELVISEAMVTQNPDLRGLVLNNFSKAARQLHKITGELQDMVMSIRMVPLAVTFQRMHRVVRDMCRKLGKEVHLELIGEETEVDKNIIERVSDPLMHLIRNAIDHGIEPSQDRVESGKPPAGTITLEAKNSGGDVLIIIRDDGRGLNKGKILARARQNNLIHKPENELTEQEIFSLIFYPGFSTKENVTEFSGRGVGMDVVMKNINAIGGSVLINSSPGSGTVITLKIPLTLAIIDGMTIAVGAARYTIPTISIRDSFRPKASDIIRDPDGNEMIMVRGQCYSIIRMHELYKVKTKVQNFEEGILVMLETENTAACVFADRLIGEQQVVVKSLPNYIKNIRDIGGIAGCTLLGDGSISLIIDPVGLINLGRR